MVAPKKGRHFIPQDKSHLGKRADEVVGFCSFGKFFGETPASHCSCWKFLVVFV